MSRVCADKKKGKRKPKQKKETGKSKKRKMSDDSEKEEKTKSILGVKVNLTLIKDGDLLTDNEVNAWQRLLKRQYPGISGMQDTLLGMI